MRTQIRKLGLGLTGLLTVAVATVSMVPAAGAATSAHESSTVASARQAPIPGVCGYYSEDSDKSNDAYYINCFQSFVNIRINYVDGSFTHDCVGPGITRLGTSPPITWATFVTPC